MDKVLILAGFILQYGLPALQRIVAMVGQKEPPTQEQWDALFVMASKSYDDYVRGDIPAGTLPAVSPLNMEGTVFRKVAEPEPVPVATPATNP